MNGRDLEGAQGAAGETPAKSWRERIAEARERGGFTFEDNEDGVGWNTCAVGEVRARYSVGEDDELNRLALEFTSTVTTHGVRFGDAEAILDAIEDRALQLKREAPEPSSATPSPTNERPSGPPAGAR